ncbi:hypothetical protein [Neobacillus massiliamazoniensis]|uniref:hypothetical protein n=1 Tax=Neobacillus massiliamazoniensis TaxID=1499688 RepID=UPI00159ED5D4|nr:hypothetical protein [Neobacillus massiliamazoniensis]
MYKGYKKAFCLKDQFHLYTSYQPIKTYTSSVDLFDSIKSIAKSFLLFNNKVIFWHISFRSLDLKSQASKEITYNSNRNSMEYQTLLTSEWEKDR